MKHFSKTEFVLISLTSFFSEAVLQVERDQHMLFLVSCFALFLSLFKATIFTKINMGHSESGPLGEMCTHSLLSNFKYFEIFLKSPNLS